MIKKLFNLVFKNEQLIKYGIIGCCCAALDFGIFWVLTHKTTMPYQFANVISMHCGIFASFFLNRHFTFKIKDKILLRFISFYAIGLTGVAISTGLLFVLIEKMEIYELISKASTVLVVALIQFLLNKFISFRHGK